MLWDMFHWIYSGIQLLLEIAHARTHFKGRAFPITKAWTITRIIKISSLIKLHNSNPFNPFSQVQGSKPSVFFNVWVSQWKPKFCSKLIKAVLNWSPFRIVPRMVKLNAVLEFSYQTDIKSKPFRNSDEPENFSSVFQDFRSRKRIRYTPLIVSHTRLI